MEEPSQTTTKPETSNFSLPKGWKIVVVEKDRLVYINEIDKTWSWLPPVEAWRSRHSLSYGLEIAQLSDSKQYYINHLKRETFRSLPVESKSSSTVIAPRTRKVAISRHSDIGYGFVAGSEKPVLIRSVAEDGPSAGKLYANDQILKINDEDVRDMPQSEVIQRIKESSQELCLEVIASDDVQDVRNRGQRKSSIMSRTTREKRRSNPVSVRFAETPVLVQYVGSPPSNPRRSSLPLIPNVLKIYLENGQTRSFLYNSTTITKDMFTSLAEKIGLKRLDRFGLVLQASQAVNDFIVQGNERVSQVYELILQIYTKRNCSSSAWLCKLLLIFAPKDIHSLFKEDPVAFDYFYRQMCSQVIEGRFGWELKYDIAIKLAALHLQQYALEEKIGKSGKISVKAIEREVGSLENFVPTALINTMQKKDLQRILTQQIKQTRNLCPPGQKYISPLEAKQQYLKICSEMKTYGGKQFNAVVVDPTVEDQKFFQDQNVSSLIFVGPNVGLAQVCNPRSYSMHQIAEFSQINGLVITPNTEGKQNIKLFLNNGKSITLIMGPIFETWDFVYLLSGYHKHLVENAKPLSVIDMTSTADVVESVDEVPTYTDTHRVLRDDCSYRRNGDENDEDIREIAFGQRPHFENSELYSLADHTEKTQPPPSVSNGSVKTHLSILVNNNQSLNCIKEEPLTPTTPKHANSSILLLPENGTYMNGTREPKRRSLLHLSDDLMSESTDDERSDTMTNSILDEQQEINTRKSPVRNHASIHISSPSHENRYVELTVGLQDSCNGDIANHVHEAQIDIPFTPSLQSSASNTSDDISSLSSGSSNNSCRTSPLTISNAILPKNTNLNDNLLFNGDNSPTADSDVSAKNSSKEDVDVDTKASETIKTDCPREDVQTNETDMCDGNRVEMLSVATTKDNPLQKDSLLFEIKANGDIKPSSLNVKQSRRRSSGYIPYNAGTQDLHIPECIIRDDASVDPSTKDDKKSSQSNKKQISVTDACDDALKTFYSLKTKLNTLNRSNYSVRTNNEVLRSKKQSMNEEVAVLEECNERVKDIAATDDNDVVEVILRAKSSLSELTESCALVYNAQYSMKHFTSELIKSIDHHIDILITTEAWNTKPVSDLTVELHKDKCELVHDSLESLHKIINSL